MSTYLLCSSMTVCKLSFIFFITLFRAGRSRILQRLIYSENMVWLLIWSHTFVTAGIDVGSLVDIIDVPVTNIRFLSCWSLSCTFLLKHISLHVLSKLWAYAMKPIIYDLSCSSKCLGLMP